MFLSDKFIQRSKEYTTLEKHVPAPFFRRGFQLKSIPKSAEITICGLGFYELYVNGKNVTKGRLAPYISNPDECVFYDRYDVAETLVKGENVVAVLLGNGFLNNPLGNPWDFQKAPFRDAPKMALAMEINKKLIFEADEAFKTSDSPIVFDDYRAGEHYDANQEKDGWNLIGFDDSDWEQAVPAKSPLGEKRLCDCESIRDIKEEKPVAVQKSENGWLYSFPHNDTGVCRLKVVNARKGQKITMTYGEVVSDGKLNLDNLLFNWSEREYMHRDVYICKGEKTEYYTPRFTYHGFQYVLVEGLDENQADADAVTFVVFHSDVEKVGDFQCSDETVNKLQACACRSLLSNFHYFPTDCPHREKNGWTGDMALSAEYMALNFNVRKSIKQWLHTMRLTQKENGQFPGIIPTAGWGYHWGNGPAWDIAIVQLCYYIYKYERDASILSENFETIVKWIDYAVSRAEERGLIGFGLGDWCQTSRPCPRYNTDLRITDTLTMMDACYKAAAIANVLGETETGNRLQAIEKELRKNFRKEFIKDGKIVVDKATQTAVAMSLYYKAFDECEEDTAVKQLIRLIHATNGHFDCGVLGARVLFRTLADHGYADLAFRLITQPSYPSYAYHLSYGATTLWEEFGELEEGRLQRKDGQKLNSLNHHFWGDISAWFYKYIAGIRINPGLKDDTLVEIKPYFIKGIEYCRAERIYDGGKIVVEWTNKNGKIDLRVDAPKGIKIMEKR